MNNKIEGKIELSESPDFEKTHQNLENLIQSLEMNEEEMNLLTGEIHDTFEDVHFELLPSFDEAGDLAIKTEAPMDQATHDDPLMLSFTLSEADSIDLNELMEVAVPLIFRFDGEGDMWIVDHPEETLFRFNRINDHKVVHSFTIPKGSEKYCIGFPGNLILDEEGCLFVLDLVQQTIHKFSGEGEYDNDFQDHLLAASPMISVRDFDLFREERLLVVSDFLRSSVKKISLEGMDMGEVILREGPAPQAFECATGVAALPGGRYFVVDPVKMAVLELDLEGHRIGGFFFNDRSRREMPFCFLMEKSPDRHLFLVDFKSQSLHAYDTNGAIKGVFQVGPNSSTPELSLGFFDFMGQGKLYFLDPRSCRIHCLLYHFEA